MERRSGKQRRAIYRFLKRNMGRRIEDLEFSLFLKMGIITFTILAISITAIALMD